MKKKIIVACGGAVATSTIAAKKVADLCRQNGIDAEICQVRISEIESNLSGAALIISTARIRKDYAVPVIMGMPFISGVGVENTAEAVLKVLQD